MGLWQAQDLMQKSNQQFIYQQAMQYRHRANISFLLLGLISAIASLDMFQGRLDFPEYCAYHGYPTEVHTIHTRDGYNLRFFRLQAKNSTITPRQKVVYLQHGLEDSSDTWVINEQHLAPGFILANRGYDVWVGNIRGNRYSSPELSPKIKQFWNYTYDQMIQYDLPASFEYIHQVAGRKIHYIGHSQGTLIMFASLATQNPVVGALLASYSALGPVTYMDHQDSIVFSAIKHAPILSALQLFDVKEMLYTGDFLKRGIATLCKYVAFPCELLLDVISEKNNTVNNLSRNPIFFSRFPCGSSLKNLQHIRQLMLTGKFRKFDYGEKQNLIAYGTKEPPAYDLTKVTFPVHMFVGEYDRLATIPDSQRTLNELGSTEKSIILLKFGHMTFVYGRDASYVNQLINIIERS